MPFSPDEITQILDEFLGIVGVRQYVGARYVPIFGRLGESSAEWDNSAPYEALTIVLYQGNSYTSRQYVPTGAAITDTTYWVETGNYNAQIEAYRNEVLRFDGRINDLEGALPVSSYSASSTVADAIAAVSAEAAQAAGDVQTLGNVMPASEFTTSHTILDALTNDVSVDHDANAYVWVCCATGDDSNHGTETEPFKTIKGALEHYRRNNQRDLRIYLGESGTYDATDIQRLTNCQLHIITQREVQANLVFDSIYMYNCYIHFEGGTNNYLNVSTGSYFHLDFGLVYLLHCNVNCESLLLQSNLVVTSSKIRVTPSSGNAVCNNGFVTLTAVEISYDNDARSRYLRFLNCQVRITSTFTLTQEGSGDRSLALFYLDDGVLLLHTTDIHTNSSGTNDKGIYLNDAIALSNGGAYTALSAIATNPYVGYGIVKRTTDISYVN